MYIILYLLIVIGLLFIFYFIVNFRKCIIEKCFLKNNEEDNYNNFLETNYDSQLEYSNDEENYTSVTINEQKQEILLASILSQYTSVSVLQKKNINCCSICLDDMEKGETIRSLPCLHMHHSHCIDDWFYRNKNKLPPSCPDCTVSIIPK